MVYCKIMCFHYIVNKLKKKAIKMLLKKQKHQETNYFGYEPSICGFQWHMAFSLVTGDGLFSRQGHFSTVGGKKDELLWLFAGWLCHLQSLFLKK